ncbi:MAG: alpha/beta fold hydrolase [Burkholderiales bacterium]
MNKDESTSRLVTSDGVAIAFSAHILEPNRPVLALVHSLGMDHTFWDAVKHHLDDQVSVVAIDARGHGGSDKGATPLSTERLAQDLSEVLNLLGLDKVVVGGASMGGCVALQFAGTFPERTSGLALIDTTAWYGASAQDDWEGRAQKAMANGLASLTEFQVTRWFSDGFRQQQPEKVRHSVDVFLRNELGGYVASCRMLGAFDGRPLLQEISVPTSIVVGEEDYAAPVEMSRAMHQAIKGSSLDIVARARHLTPLEVPEHITQALVSLCQKVGP